jgi:hypothetical protein
MRHEKIDTDTAESLKLLSNTVKESNVGTGSMTMTSAATRASYSSSL